MDTPFVDTPFGPPRSGLSLPFWTEFCWVLHVRVASRVDTEFPYRARIVERGVDCRDPVCRHRFRFPDLT